MRVLPIILAAITALGIAWSVGPYLDYREVERERAEMEAEVALLEQENEAVQEQIDRLGYDSYLEELARRELNLVRPGEDVFIIRGVDPSTTEIPPAADGAEPGTLEKVLESIRDLF